jgi:hypothetical protein
MVDGRGSMAVSVLSRHLQTEAASIPATYCRPPQYGPSQSVGGHLHALEYREAGASPALPRNCERGRNLRQATGRTAGKVQGVGRSVSQET